MYNYIRHPLNISNPIYRYERGDNGSWSKLHYTLNEGVTYPAVVMVDMMDFQCEGNSTTSTTTTTSTTVTTTTTENVD